MTDRNETTMITTSPDGTTTVISDGGNAHGVVAGGHEIDGGSFFAGVLVTLLALAMTKALGRVRRRRALPAAEAAGTELAALRKRTAVLERIVTDPAARVAREIEALR